jgi:pimeloyl-ACP methyl ester carboxylesterase
MPKRDSKKRPKHLHPSDIRSAAKLATQATTGVVDIAEGVHRSVLDTLGIPGPPCGEKTGGFTGLVYQSVRSVTKLVGSSLDKVLSRLEPLLKSVAQTPVGSPEREAFLAALNGVMGDRLALQDNPLAINLTLRYQGQDLDWAALPTAFNGNSKVLLMAHGLCMNDLQWGRQHEKALTSSLDYTPIYARYNSGLHISQNGRLLSARLEQLIAHWPSPLEDLTVIAHSMGGLVIRAAFHYGKLDDLHWPELLKSIVFLGSPHHGSPLERTGNWADTILDSNPYSAPFSKLGKIRSSGITDLRHGYILEDDWHDRDRFGDKGDNRVPVPLPAEVACYAVAAAIGPKRGTLTDRVVGDGLVPIRSALGQHDDARRNLEFTDARVLHGMNHMALLSDPGVTQQIERWLTPK